MSDFDKIAQTATLSQVLNLTNTELHQLADFLGHDIRVHRQFYRLPEGTLQLAKISKVLMALEQGCLAEFKGKSLDDISIDPEGTKYLIVLQNKKNYLCIFGPIHSNISKEYKDQVMHFSLNQFPFSPLSPLYTETVHLDNDQDRDPEAPCDPEATDESDSPGEPPCPTMITCVNCHGSKDNHNIPFIG